MNNQGKSPKQVRDSELFIGLAFVGMSILIIGMVIGKLI